MLAQDPRAGPSHTCRAGRLGVSFGSAQTRAGSLTEGPRGGHAAGRLQVQGQPRRRSPAAPQKAACGATVPGFTRETPAHSRSVTTTRTWKQCRDVPPDGTAHALCVAL